MAFLIHSVDDGHVPAWEYLPCAAITPKVGMALTFSSGNLTTAAGTVKPGYICMAEKSAACTAGDLIPVIRVNGDIVFETVSSASMASIKPGDKVTIASDGLRVTATTTSGVAGVVEVLDSASGGAVRIRF